MTARVDWNPDLHPRGRDGKFIEKFGFVELFGVPGHKDGSRGEVKDIVPNKARPGDPDIIVTVDGKDVTARPNQLSQATQTKAKLDQAGGDYFSLPEGEIDHKAEAKAANAEAKARRVAEYGTDPYAELRERVHGPKSTKPATAKTGGPDDPFIKGDRVTVTSAPDPQYIGQSGTVEKNMHGGAGAIVRLDSGTRISIRQEQLESEGASDEPEVPVVDLGALRERVHGPKPQPPDKLREQAKPGDDGLNPIGVPDSVTDAEEEGSRYNPIKTDDPLKAVEALHDGKYVQLETIEQVATLLDKLANIANEAKAAGEKAKNYDLCLVTVPKTNLFCAESKDIPRIKMPQLGGIPVPGSRADVLPKDANGEVNIAQHFVDYLRNKGVSVEEIRKPAGHLKASQSELVGTKVAGMMKAMESGNEKAIQNIRESAIFTTTDNYVVDGHHRWAAVVGLDVADGTPLGDIDMPVRQIDMDILEVLEEANAFALDFGIAPKGTPGGDAPVPQELAESARETFKEASVRSDGRLSLERLLGGGTPTRISRARPALAIRGLGFGDWNPDLHPRGRDGQFIQKFGWVDIFGHPNLPDGTRGEVVEVRPNPRTPGRPDVLVKIGRGGPGFHLQEGVTITTKPLNVSEAPLTKATLTQEVVSAVDREESFDAFPERLKERMGVFGEQEGLSPEALQVALLDEYVAKQMEWQERNYQRDLPKLNAAAESLTQEDPHVRYQQLDNLFDTIRASGVANHRRFDRLPGGGWSAERRARHEAIWQELLANVETAHIPKDRDVLALGGLPGSGKTTALKPGQPAAKLGVVGWNPDQPIPEGATHIVINPDVVKVQLIEAGMAPEGVTPNMKPMEQSTFLHEESSWLSKLFMARLSDMGYNLVLDNTMDSTRGMDKRFIPLAEKGYRFRGLFADIGVRESRKSAYERYIRQFNSPLGGRFVPSSVIRNKESPRGSLSNNRDNFDELVADDWFIDWLVLDNQGVSEQKPKAEVIAQGKGPGSAATDVFNATKRQEAEDDKLVAEMLAALREEGSSLDGV